MEEEKSEIKLEKIEIEESNDNIEKNNSNSIQMEEIQPNNQLENVQSFRPFTQGLVYQLSVNLVDYYSKINQVMKAISLETNKVFAIKIIKKNPMFYKQGLVEIEFLTLIREKDPLDDNGIVRLHDHFEEKNHLFLVFEHLSINLYELLQKTQFKGISIDLIRKFAYQIIRSLIFLSDEKIIHSDLKPENILLCHPQKCAIKIIDFGSSCKSNEIIYKYTQSRFYRAPEVLLELGYNVSIDMWSFACILVELYTGDPLFAGVNEEDQISEILGLPPVEMISQSPKQHVFFVKRNDKFYLKSGKGRNVEEGISFHSIIKRKKQTNKEEFDFFIDFIGKLLKFDPSLRHTPFQCLNHPFFTKSIGKYRKEKTPERRRTTGNKRPPNFQNDLPHKRFQRYTQ